MIVILYIAVAIIAIAFLILVIGLVRTLSSLKVILEQVSGTLNNLEGQMKGITSETTLLLHKTNALAEDIQEKTTKLNGVVHAVGEVGTTINDLNRSVKNVSTKITDQFDKNKEKISQIVQWGNTVLEIRNKFLKKKKPTSLVPMEVNHSLTETEPEFQEVQRVRG